MSVNVYKGSEGLINVGGGSSGAFVGTLQEWNDLPVADKAKYDGKEVIITDDYSDVNTLDIYSTEEVKTNKVWIDDKPIYRKVVTNLRVTINEDTGWVNIHAESSVDSLVDIKPYTGTGIWYGSMLYKIESGYLKGYSTGLNTEITGYMIEYTKTTD